MVKMGGSGQTKSDANAGPSLGAINKYLSTGFSVLHRRSWKLRIIEGLKPLLFDDLNRRPNNEGINFYIET